MDAHELACELARRCRDSDSDGPALRSPLRRAKQSGLDMDIAQAPLRAAVWPSHAVRVLRELTAENPAGVWPYGPYGVALGNLYVCEDCPRLRT
jgi:hypothetical protein